MTFKQLKEKLLKLTVEQLRQKIVYTDDYDNNMSVKLYIAKDDIPDQHEDGNDVKKGMPHMGNA